MGSLTELRERPTNAVTQSANAAALPPFSSATTIAPKK
jgi:hypothetical protein